MSEPNCPRCQARQRRVAELEQRVDELTRLLDETQRPRPPRRSATPDQVQETITVALTESCPVCGGSVVADHRTEPFWPEIPRQLITGKFEIRAGHCPDCGQRVQGRHPLQTSDATGTSGAATGRRRERRSRAC